MDYKQKVEEKRKKMVDTLISFIEQDPAQWEAGWYKAPSISPLNGKTQRNYKGLNAFYLYVIALQHGYRDPRWFTFNQVKEFGGNVKSGEKSSEIFFWTWYDKKTKKPFDVKTLDGMTDEEKQEYKQENVRPVIKFYQVFNAQQCDKLPEYELIQTPEMAVEERARQNDLIETVIANSEAPVYYDGGNRAYYSPMSDSIHLPEIKDFKTMQDYYATALHEIAHSTGHESRLNRSLKGIFGSPDYAREELRAELASVFIQTELSISVEGKHFENHGAYLASWLKAVKDNPKEFYSAASDAEKISDYVSSHYLKEREREDIYGIVYDWQGLKEENSLYTAKQLKELDPAFVEGVDRYEGGFSGDKTYTVYKLTGSNPAETEQSIRKFLTGGYNVTGDMVMYDGWYWETVDTNLFTDGWNETTLEYIKRLGIQDEDLRMKEGEVSQTADEEMVGERFSNEPIEQAKQAEQAQQAENTKETNSAFRKDLRRKIMSDGFKVNFLRGRQFDGFATATVSKRTGLRNLERGINSESLAAVFPFVFTSIIEPDGFTLGYDYYPVILDIWKRDNQQYINSNMMVIGKSGSGNSFFTKTLLSLIYSENSRIYILDPENEYLNLCRNVGGRFIDVGNATEGRINPLHIYQILTDEGTPAEPEVVFAAHLQFLESFFRITLSGITSDSLEELNNIVSKVYEERGITEQTDCSQLSPEDFPVFDDLLKVVDRELDKETLPSRKANLERVKTYVAKLAAGGRFANLWNGASTLTSDERLVVFNFQSLLGAKNNTVSNAQMLVIMRYLDQQIINIREMNRLGRANIHPFVAIDEGYNFIDPENPVALDFVFLWYKRIRKYNGSIMFLTQNLSDILGNAAIVQKTTAIINNTQYSFIFSLAPADLAILTDLYRTAGEINDTERNQIANAGNGECFAICSARERTSFKVVASDVVYTLFDFPDALRMIADGDVRSPYKRNNTAS